MMSFSSLSFQAGMWKVGSVPCTALERLSGASLTCPTWVCPERGGLRTPKFFTSSSQD